MVGNIIAVAVVVVIYLTVDNDAAGVVAASVLTIIAIVVAA
jgi:hypothetical protein